MGFWNCIWSSSLWSFSIHWFDYQWLGHIFFIELFFRISQTSIFLFFSVPTFQRHVGRYVLVISCASLFLSFWVMSNMLELFVTHNIFYLLDVPLMTYQSYRHYLELNWSYVFKLWHSFEAVFFYFNALFFSTVLIFWLTITFWFFIIDD